MSSGEVASMSTTPWFKEPPLWAHTQSRVDDGRMMQLHKELLSFYEQAMPKQKDADMRAHALERITLVIEAFWPSSKVKVFGSFATGIYLPQFSDIDLVIVGAPQGRWDGDHEHVRALAAALRSSGVASHVNFIGRAKVPILKFREDQSGIRFDVSFTLNQELRAADFIASARARYPCFAPLYLFLKAYLQLKHLNEVYHTGGLNSYTLFVMLFTFLTAHPCGNQALYESGLGFLLVGFLHFYGVSLNVQAYGISCLHGAGFFLKTRKNFFNYRRPYLLAVEDPLMPSNDIGKNSFSFPNIQAVFKKSYESLMFSQLNNVSSSLLSAIMPLQQMGIQTV